MSIEEPMNVNERRKYLHKMRIRYWQTQNRAEKKRLLDEMVSVTRMHRKSILRLIHGELARRPRRTQRGREYGLAVDQAVGVIAESLDYPCAERLMGNLIWMADQLVRHGELELEQTTREQLGQISLASLRRCLKRLDVSRKRIAYRRMPKSPRTGPSQVPIQRIAFDQPLPGHFEIDLVHHCGISASGQYVHTLQMTDVATGWCECVAILGRSGLVVRDGFQRIQARLPFPILEAHSDNGDEFLNHFQLHFWHAHAVQLSRSRPFHKNDNRFVEENNHSLVRAYVGFSRLDTVEHTRLLNQLYDRLWLFHNFFQPLMRLKEKLPTPTRLKRIYDQPQPPFARLCAAAILSPQRQAELSLLFNQTNPRVLRLEIRNLIDVLASRPLAKEGSIQDVYLSLFAPTLRKELDVR